MVTFCKIRGSIFAMLVCCGALSAPPAYSQSQEAIAAASAPYVAQEPSDGDVLIGTWTYRSLINDPDVSREFNKLRFAAATITFDEAPMGELRGTLGGPGWSLALKGNRGYGNPFSVRFQGKGMIGDQLWIYDYVGYLVPSWPNGENQRPAIVGSVIRTVPHSDSSGGTAPAGYVASFIAVKK